MFFPYNTQLIEIQTQKPNNWAKKIIKITEKINNLKQSSKNRNTQLRKSNKISKNSKERPNKSKDLTFKLSNENPQRTSRLLSPTRLLRSNQN